MKIVQFNKTCLYLTVVLLSTSVLILRTITNFDNAYDNVVQTSTTEAMFRPTQERRHLKHVTKSLDQLGKMDEINSHILFFNRIPHSGSEILSAILEKLQGWNNFRVVSLGESRRMLTSLEQEELVDEVSNAIRNDPVPLCFERPVHFVNFSNYDKQSPTFINIIRNPIDNIVARYNAYENKNKKLQQYKLEECIKKSDPRCIFTKGQPYDLTISYFCGKEPECMYLDSNYAFRRAKENVEKYYTVIGVYEELNTTLEVFENKLPYFFKGAQQINNKFTLGKQDNIQVTTYVRRYLKKKLNKEIEFYHWIKGRLFQQLQIIYGEHHNHK